MASIRNLKKDIDYLTNEVVNTAYLAIGIHGEKIEQKVIDLLEEVIDFHNSLYQKIQDAPTGKKNKQAKPYFREIRQAMDEKYPEFFAKLSKIISQQ
ncbi:MAG: hypothetical protein N2449_01500 [Bacteroidales bacterium]|nr:hypothetical protein [Bacteroidales bacterium]